MSNAIEVRELLYQVKTFEIRDFTLNVPSGSIYGFLGPNGCGKTTTIQLLLGLRRARGGSISVLGHAVPRGVTRVLARTGYVPEHPHLYPNLTVDESLQYHAAFYPGWDRDRAKGMLSRFDLRGSQAVGRLSKGETGKLLVLVALAQMPELLVLDEPTDGLDPVVRRDVMTALLDYVSEHKATVFVSSHLVHELERACDWIGVMDRGRMVVEMPMQSFKRGIKRLRFTQPPALTQETPFEVLSRSAAESTGLGEEWLVSGWEPAMAQALESGSGALREIVDMDLEESFVALLSRSRASLS
jgi:ABC-2 type transport system ATP-binding protein